MLLKQNFKKNLTYKIKNNFTQFKNIVIQSTKLSPNRKQTEFPKATKYFKNFIYKELKTFNLST